MKLDKLVNDYRVNHLLREQSDLDAYKASPNFDYLLMRAITGLTEEGKRHSHKYRISQSTFRSVYKYLKEKENEFRACKTFEEVLAIIYFGRLDGFCAGFGPLSIYDTALCIAAYLNIYPEFIYLHCGAEQGAINLLGLERLNEKASFYLDDLEFSYLLPMDFPLEVQELSPFHIENFLCIYKDLLKSA